MAGAIRIFLGLGIGSSSIETRQSVSLFPAGIIFLPFPAIRYFGRWLGGLIWKTQLDWQIAPACVFPSGLRETKDLPLNLVSSSLRIRNRKKFSERGNKRRDGPVSSLDAAWAVREPGCERIRSQSNYARHNNRSAPALFLGTAAKVTGGESGSRTKSQGIGSV